MKDVIEPAHNKSLSGNMDVFDVAKEFGITNPAQSMALKYVLRAGKKGEYKEDINKAIKCLERAICLN